MLIAIIILGIIGVVYGIYCAREEWKELNRSEKVRYILLISACAVVAIGSLVDAFFYL